MKFWYYTDNVYKRNDIRLRLLIPLFPFPEIPNSRTRGNCELKIEKKFEKDAHAMKNELLNAL